MIKQVELTYSDGIKKRILLYEDEINWFVQNEGDHLIECRVLNQLYEA